MNVNYLILIISAALASLGQLFFKLGGSDKGLDLILSGRLWLGMLFYGLGTMLWIYALSKLPLNKAYPFTALTFVFVFLLSYFVLEEPISLIRIIGILVILIGFIILYYAN